MSNDYNYIVLIRRGPEVQIKVVSDPDKYTMVMGVTTYVTGSYGSLRVPKLVMKICGVDVDEDEPLKQFVHWVKIEHAHGMLVEKIEPIGKDLTSEGYKSLNSGWCVPYNMVLFTTSQFKLDSLTGNIVVICPFTRHIISLGKPVAEPKKFEGALYCVLSIDTTDKYILTEFIESNSKESIIENRKNIIHIVRLYDRQLDSAEIRVLSNFYHCVKV